MATRLITRPNRSGPAAWARIACTSGRMSPPPRPCTTRNAIRLSTDHTAAHSTDPVRNTVSAPIHTRLEPKRSISHPIVGITAAIDSR
ncbi:hypothetical protein FDG2_3375 [Candidatus Protofrankia californiensis]|uniref:Uncharacterized protein n=1 Tax=Candidatus Protofrankia californiensis TaxID=1839754 RepID=A0A1C3NZL2_9ACTN|nr:hypothetical protein FDG2_3375 [Candidatus Protofrankia californiensis]